MAIEVSVQLSVPTAPSEGSHVVRKTELDAVSARVDNLEQLGHLLGIVPTHADLPATVTAAQTLWGASSTPTVNDFADVQADEDNDGKSDAYAITAIDASGNITWESAPFRTYDTDLSSREPTMVKVTETQLEAMFADPSLAEDGVKYYTDGGLDGIPDAPADGMQYGRQNNAWTQITDAYVQTAATNQTIDGVKTFSASPVVPSKVTAADNDGTELATEAQVYQVASSIVTPWAWKGATTTVTTGGIDINLNTTATNASQTLISGRYCDTVAGSIRVDANFEIQLYGNDDRRFLRWIVPYVSDSNTLPNVYVYRDASNYLHLLFKTASPDANVYPTVEITCVATQINSGSPMTIVSGFTGVDTTVDPAGAILITDRTPINGNSINMSLYSTDPWSTITKTMPMSTAALTTGMYTFDFDYLFYRSGVINRGELKAGFYVNESGGISTVAVARDSGGAFAGKTFMVDYIVPTSTAAGYLAISFNCVNSLMHAHGLARLVRSRSGGEMSRDWINLLQDMVATYSATAPTLTSGISINITT
jgi:hypothetical protein